MAAKDQKEIDNSWNLQNMNDESLESIEEKAKAFDLEFNNPKQDE